MLRRLTVSGFKSLVDLDIELGRLNVFVGANGAGKSNLLEAVGLLGCAVSGRVGPESFTWRGVRPGQPALFKSAFSGKSVPRIIKLSAGFPRAHYRVGLDNPVGRPRRHWSYQSETLAFGRNKLGTRSSRGLNLYSTSGARLAQGKPDPEQGLCPLARTLHDDAELIDALDALESYAIYTPYTPMLRGLVPDPSERSPLGLSGGGLARAMLGLDEAAREWVMARSLGLIDWADRVEPESDGSNHGQAKVWFRDRFLNRSRGWLAAADVSEGALYVLFLFLLLRHPRASPLCAVDNVNAALNPRLARALVAQLQRAMFDDGLPGQLLLTGHNPLLLDGLDLSNDEVRLFIVERDTAGHTKVRRLPFSDALAKAQAKGMTLSRLWVNGTLGGVPEL